MLFTIISLIQTNSLVVRERDGSTSPSRYSSSTTSLYRASRYALPFQHYAMSSAYHHFAPLSGTSATSASTGYLLSTSSPLRQRRRPWERGAGGGGGLYDRYDDSIIYRHYDVGSSGNPFIIRFTYTFAYKKFSKCNDCSNSSITVLRFKYIHSIILKLGQVYEQQCLNFDDRAEISVTWWLKIVPIWDK